MTRMRVRGSVTLSVMTALAAGLSGCASDSVTPPPVVATLPPPPAPTMPYGGYVSLQIPPKRKDGTYVTPNFAMTDPAAVWHLRNALNVAALGCDKAGGGVAVGYNAWLVSHGHALDTYMKAYLHEWEITGWGDWQDAYDNNQTRIYNFYSNSTIRVAFCAAARVEIATIDSVKDADLPTYSRAALARLDKPFIDFYTAFDAWRDYYQPKPPPVVRTVPDAPGTAPVASATPAPQGAPSATPIAVATPSPEVAMSAGTVTASAQPAPAPIAPKAPAP